MKCTACNADLSDSARFCPYCGHAVAAEAPEATTEAAPDNAASPVQEPPADPFKTQVISTYDDPMKTQVINQTPYGQTQPQQQPYGQPAFDANAQSQPFDAYGQPQGQSPYAASQMGDQSAYGAYGQQSQSPYGAPVQPQGQVPYGAPVQPQGQPSYGTYGQPQQGMTQLQGYPAADGAVAQKSKKTPIIIGVIVAVVIVAVLGVCVAMGVGPFARGGSGGGGQLDPNGDPIAQLNSAVQDIQSTGNFDGTFSVNMDMDLGSLGSLAGMETVNYAMNGTYSMENYDPDDLSKLKMHMTMNIDVMGETQSATIDLDNGQATITENGNTQTVSYDTSEIEDILKQSGGMSLDVSQIEQYVKSSRIEGDTIIIELDEGFLDQLLSESLASSGMSGMDAQIDGLELRAKVSNGTIEETMDMTFAMSYMGYDISADMDILYTLAKK